MDDSQLIFGVISLGVSLFALLGVFQFVLRPTTDAVYQQRLDSMRTEILMLCLDGFIDAAHPAYGHINSLIEFASVEVPRLSYLRIALSSKAADSESIPWPPEALPDVVKIIEASGRQGLTPLGTSALVFREIEVLDLAVAYLRSRAPFQIFAIWAFNSFWSWLRAGGNAVGIGRWRLEERAIRIQFGLLHPAVD